MGAEAEDGEPREKVKRGWDYVVPMPTDPDAYEECQSVRFHKPPEVEKEEVKEEKEQQSENKLGTMKWKTAKAAKKRIAARPRKKKRKTRRI